MPVTPASAVLAALLDRDSFTSWDPPAEVPVPGPGAAANSYADELRQASAASGCAEAVITGEGRIAGRPVALLLGEFGFLAGSVGAEAARRLVAAMSRATRDRLPLLASPASGGTRMQEGTPAFVRMADIAAALARHRAAGLPYLVWLRNPTTGGVMATWGSLGQITAAEPGALAGFLGPRVYAVLRGEPFPPGVQTAENLAAAGVIDAVVPLDQLRSAARRVLGVLGDRQVRADSPGGAPGLEPVFAPDSYQVDAWDCVLRSRDPRRPGARDVVAQATDLVPLSGTGHGETGGAVQLALARFGGASCVVVAQDRQAERAGLTVGPAGLRLAQRGMSLAEELRLPFVTLIDTTGAELSVAAEEGALAGEIARCLARLSALPVPTVSVVVGAGCGGGALALVPADRVLVSAHGWISPLPPEGASVIRYRTPDHAAQLAREQRIGAAQLRADGIADHVVAEHPDAAREPPEFAARVAAAIGGQLNELLAADSGTLLAARARRYGARQ